MSVGTEKKVDLNAEIVKGPKRVFRDYELLRWGNGGTLPNFATTGGGGTGNWAGTGYTPKLCTHKGDKFATIVSSDDMRVEFYPVQQREVESIRGKVHMWISCNGDQRQALPLFIGSSGNGAALGLEKILSPTQVRPACLWLNWKDRGIPDTVNALAFWPAMVKGMFKEAETRSGTLRVAVSCIGSHGRTGTFLACILGVMGVAGEEAMKAVRAGHCNEAIETKEQEQYIIAVAENLHQKGLTIPGKVVYVKKGAVA